MSEKVMLDDLDVTRTEATAVECVTAYVLRHMGELGPDDSDFELSAAAGIFKTAYTDSGRTWPKLCDDYQRGCDLSALGVEGSSGFYRGEISGARYVVRALFERFEFKCERVD